MKLNKIIRKSGSIIFIGVMSLLSFTPFKKNHPSGGKNVYDFKIKTIDGESISLSKYKGKKLLLVNVASECGYTPQYKDLQALYEKYNDKLVVIGFPANNFGAQEPGDNKQIKNFCTSTYGVTFPMMEKISVKGDDTHPLYQFLKNKDENGCCNDAPVWNFCKYLIDENGKVIKFFNSKVTPLSDEITSLL
ncbi:MAG: glutathione peroxidase [Sphingobacteriaceae bacterium]|nr:glutathione peroxidase [Sphingobacteriaceae bacterium]